MTNKYNFQNVAHYFKKASASLFIFTLIMVSIGSSPKPAAATTNYQPQSAPELIAYLQGVIATLEAQLNSQGTKSNTTVNNNTNTSLNLIETLAVQSLGTDSVVLQGRITSGYANATVWFEYGQSLLTDFSTPRQRLSNNLQIFSASLNNLRRNSTYSYRAVIELSNGTRYYGAIGTFSTDRNLNDSGNNFSSSNLTTDQTRYDRGATIKVDWRVANNKTSTLNWIGIYKAGATDTSYSSWKTVSAQNGRVDFTAPSVSGTYEFRVFYNNGYELLDTSRTFTVN